MKLRGLMVATLVLLALMGTLYWSEHKKPADDTKASAASSPTILKLDEASITKLELKKANSELITLAKNDSGAWQIMQPKPFGADATAVSGVLSSLSSLDSERVVADKASDLKPFGLDHPTMEVDIAEKNNKTQQLLLGDNTPAGNAVYAILTGDPRVFTIASYKKADIDKSLTDLRDKRLLTLRSDQISRLELTSKGQEIEFGRNKDEWQILKPKPLRADSTQVSELVGKLTDARMDLSTANADATETASAFDRAALIATAKLTNPSGTQELQIRKDKDNYYAKSSVVEGFYKVDATLGQALDKKLDDFRNKKLFDFGYSEPTKIEMHDGSKAYFLSRTGADWWSNGKKMDADSVETFISSLRDLAASKFVDSDFANPTIRLIITSDDGKRVENVSLAKSRDGFLAERENDPTLYYLEANPIETLQKTAGDIKPAATVHKS